MYFPCLRRARGTKLNTKGWFFCVVSIYSKGAFIWEAILEVSQRKSFYAACLPYGCAAKLLQDGDRLINTGGRFFCVVTNVVFLQGNNTKEPSPCVRGVSILNYMV